mmetsp:Transcript_53333/g.120256  ORF Transcript_53333/g.120256 Transcript_53333/m.120256 type:complete len:202 (-) Transcript_53333:85-690(-)
MSPTSMPSARPTPMNEVQNAMEAEDSSQASCVVEFTSLTTDSSSSMSFDFDQGSSLVYFTSLTTDSSSSMSFASLEFCSDTNSSKSSLDDASAAAGSTTSRNRGTPSPTQSVGGDPSPQGQPDRAEASGLPSNPGSNLHSLGKCSPCAWYWTKSRCSNTDKCLFCHICEADTLNRRWKEKKKQLKLLKLSSQKDRSVIISL